MLRHPFAVHIYKHFLALCDVSSSGGAACVPTEKCVVTPRFYERPLPSAPSGEAHDGFESD